MKEVKVKKFKYGTCYTAEYYVDGELICSESEHNYNCGTFFFLSLKEEKDAELQDVYLVDYMPKEVEELLEEE